jgi:hypothetical protein
MNKQLKERLRKARVEYNRLKELGQLPNPTKDWSLDSLESLKQALSWKNIKNTPQEK